MHSYLSGSFFKFFSEFSYFLFYRAVLEDDAFTRMKAVVKWYLSGFYKKPQGLKKPYNPLLGETFRCYWQHPNGSRTFYLAEQVMMRKILRFCAENYFFYLNQVSLCFVFNCICYVFFTIVIASSTYLGILRNKPPRWIYH